jgi:hypothetical protein
LVNAVALSDVDCPAPSRGHASWRGALLPVAALLPSAILLGVLRVWSLAVAPQLGVYFTAEALLVLYACFAITRAANVSANSYDEQGRWCSQLARQAKHTFFAGLRREWARIARIVVPLLLGALLLDMLTAGTRAQFRPNIHLSLMFVELMAWWRYGSVIAIAAAQWTPAYPPALARARVLVSKSWLNVLPSLALAHIALSAAGLAGLAVHGSRVAGAGPLVLNAPDVRIALACHVALCAGLAWLALALLCRGSLAVMVRDRGRKAARRASRQS